jgi:hypothetical protein
LGALPPLLPPSRTASAGVAAAAAAALAVGLALLLALPLGTGLPALPLAAAAAAAAPPPAAVLLSAGRGSAGSGLPRLRMPDRGIPDVVLSVGPVIAGLRRRGWLARLRDGGIALLLGSFGERVFLAAGLPLRVKDTLRLAPVALRGSGRNRLRLGQILLFVRHSVSFMRQINSKRIS